MAQQRDEIIAQRFQYGTSPVGAVVLFGLCLPGRGAKHSRAFWVRGAKNDVLADFTKLVIFMTKLIQDQELYALHQESRKVQCFI